MEEKPDNSEGQGFVAGENPYAKLADERPAEEAQEDINPNELRDRMHKTLERNQLQDLRAELEKLFESGMDVDQPDHEGRTALMMCSAKGQKDAVQMLLDRGADVNHVFMYHERIPFTALDAAKQMGKPEIVELLVAAGGKSGRELEPTE